MPVQVRWVATSLELPVQRPELAPPERDAIAAAELAAVAPPPATTMATVRLPELSDLETARLRAVRLLCVAAEIEHQLLVQYLFGAFSLRPPDDPGLPAGAGAKLTAWGITIREVAREEMG